jgi:hypothetical protein
MDHSWFGPRCSAVGCGAMAKIRLISARRADLRESAQYRGVERLSHITTFPTLNAASFTAKERAYHCPSISTANCRTSRRKRAATSAT